MKSKCDAEPVAARSTFQSFFWPLFLIGNSITMFAHFTGTVAIIDAGGAKYVWIATVFTVALGALTWRQYWKYKTAATSLLMVLATSVWLYAIGTLIYSIFSPIEPVELVQ